MKPVFAFRRSLHIMRMFSFLFRRHGRTGDRPLWVGSDAAFAQVVVPQWAEKLGHRQAVGVVAKQS